MRFIRPIAVVDGIFTSNVPEPDPSVGEIEWTTGTYTTGTQRVVSADHKVYEVVADPSTSESPAGGNSSDWVEVKSTNRYRMFDGVIGAKTEYPSSIEFSFTPNLLFNGFSAFGLVGQSAIVEMNDPSEGLVYSKQVDLRDESAVVDFYEYFFEPIVQVDNFTLTDLPAYTTATVSITVTAEDTAEIGEVAIGKQILIGEGLYGSSYESKNFSEISRDDFGFLTITKRDSISLLSYNVLIDKSDFPYVKNQLVFTESTPVVWIGTDDLSDGTVVYGISRKSTINFSSPQKYDCTIKVEGLI